MACILREFVDGPILFVPAFPEIERFTFSVGLSVVIYFFSVCVVVISCGSLYQGKRCVGSPSRSIAMNYSSFGLTLSEGARFPAISVYTHQSCVCMCVCMF